MTEAAVARQLGVPRGKGRPLGWWGVVFAVVTEAMLFGLLLFVWYYLRSQAAQWPPEGVRDPELLRSGIRSALLFLSSATMSFADRGIRNGRRGRLLVGLAVTFLLASVFMAGHVEELLKLPEEFLWSDHAYGSAWYVITNFHAAHLAVGMAFMAYAFLAGLRGRYDGSQHLGVTVVSIYWHFVDVVWVFVYTSLYILPHVT